MKKSDATPSGSLSVPPKSFQFVAVDVSKYQTPDDSPVLDRFASTSSAPIELQHDDSSPEAAGQLKEKEKPFRWVHVDPTEVPGSLRFRILPVCTPETPGSNNPVRNHERSVERDCASSSTDDASELSEIDDVPPQSQSPTPEAEEPRFIPRRRTFFEVVLNPA